jgi:hypothetical protein
MGEAGATTPILHLSLLIRAPRQHCTASPSLLEHSTIGVELVLAGMFR